MAYHEAIHAAVDQAGIEFFEGAFLGQIDEEELFYLRSRGITELTAKQLIVTGFLYEVVERIGNKAIGEKLATLIQSKFDRAKSKA